MCRQTCQSGQHDVARLMKPKSSFSGRLIFFNCFTERHRRSFQSDSVTPPCFLKYLLTYLLTCVFVLVISQFQHHTPHIKHNYNIQTRIAEKFSVTMPFWHTFFHTYNILEYRIYSCFAILSHLCACVCTGQCYCDAEFSFLDEESIIFFVLWRDIEKLFSEIRVKGYALFCIMPMTWREDFSKGSI